MISMQVLTSDYSERVNNLTINLTIGSSSKCHQANVKQFSLSKCCDKMVVGGLSENLSCISDPAST